MVRFMASSLMPVCPWRSSTLRKQITMPREESAAWLGVPYRGGGNSKRGVDCSGLTSHLYKKVYHKKLKRNSDDQRTQDCHKVSKRNLREGDLVFFHNGRKKRIASHVGIYLKDNKFIHASTSRGVIISSLNEDYGWIPVWWLRFLHYKLSVNA